MSGEVFYLRLSELSTTGKALVFKSMMKLVIMDQWFISPMKKERFT